MQFESEDGVSDGEFTKETRIVEAFFEFAHQVFLCLGMRLGSGALGIEGIVVARVVNQSAFGTT